MPTKVEYGPSDIRPRSLELIGLGAAIAAGVAMLFVEGAWFTALAVVLVVGVIFAAVGAWSERKVQRGEFRHPTRVR